MLHLPRIDSHIYCFHVGNSFVFPAYNPTDRETPVVPQTINIAYVGKDNGNSGYISITRPQKPRGSDLKDFGFWGGKKEGTKKTNKVAGSK